MRWFWAVFLISSSGFSETSSPPSPEPGAAIVGRVAYLKGDVKIKSKASGQLSQPILGRDVSEADTIITGSDGRIKVYFEDDSELNISPASTVEMVKYGFAGENRNVLLNVLSGRVRTILQQKYDNPVNTFEVKTPTALIAALGTDSVIEYIKPLRTTRIVTFKGSIHLASLTNNGPGGLPILVKPGQSAQLTRGKPPTSPKEVEKDELASLENETKMDVMPPDQHPAAQPASTSRKRRH
jgi:ferric-dicitrate binding protein FerR (iron transport regulator)